VDLDAGSGGEIFMTRHFDALVCNGGVDFPMIANGASFTCIAAGGKTFTVTIDSKDTGSYLVQ
jgi:hypothetical protein